MARHPQKVVECKCRTNCNNWFLFWGGGMLSNPHVIYLSAFIYVDANATGHNSLWSCLLRLDLSEVFFMMVMVVDEGYSNWYDSGSWLLLEC